MWWAITSTTWQYQELMQLFIDVCWNEQVAAYAAGLANIHYFKTLYTGRSQSIDGLVVAA